MIPFEIYICCNIEGVKMKGNEEKKRETEIKREVARKKKEIKTWNKIERESERE